MWLTTQRMAELISLIQQYREEARRILAAIDDGLTLGPAQMMPGVWECEPFESSTEPPDFHICELAQRGGAVEGWRRNLVNAEEPDDCAVSISVQLNSIHRRLNSHDLRFDAIDTRFGRLEGRMETGFKTIQGALDRILRELKR